MRSARASSAAGQAGTLSRVKAHTLPDLPIQDALPELRAALATHALTVGVIGGLTLGMMTRTSRGHTARALKVGRWEVACYVLVHSAAFVRVFFPLVVPGAYVAFIELSALLWCAAFAIFTAVYYPILSRPRLDGQPG